MYSVVGSDGQVYGPVDTATLNLWIAEGRIVPTTNLIDPLDGRVIQAQMVPAFLGSFGNGMTAPPPNPYGGQSQPYYGYPRPELMSYGPPAKSKVAAIVLALFLGGLGVHRFYLGHSGTGTTMLLLFLAGFFTCGATHLVVGIWALVDLIQIATGSLRESNGRALA